MILISVLLPRAVFTGKAMHLARQHFEAHILQRLTPPKVILMLRRDRSGGLHATRSIAQPCAHAQSVKIGAVDAAGPPPSRPSSTENRGRILKAHLRQIGHGFLVDRHKLVDDDVVVLEVRLDHAETLDVVTVLDFLALHQLVGQRDEDFAGLLRIPHEAAGNRIAT